MSQLRTIDEPFVKERTQEALARLGYPRLSRRRRTVGEGADIIAWKPATGISFVVECKGEGRADDPKVRDSQKEVAIISSLGQILTRFTSRNGRNYGLAYPASFRRRAMGKLSEPVVSLLRLHLFFVSADGSVEHLPPIAVKRAIRERKAA